MIGITDYMITLGFSGVMKVYAAIVGALSISLIVVLLLMCVYKYDKKMSKK